MTVYLVVDLFFRTLPLIHDWFMGQFVRLGGTTMLAVIKDSPSLGSTTGLGLGKFDFQAE